ncbi:MAG TPA: rhodanese-like domain-containing protein [Gemmataceae bacterium]|nr:rhodanese-like domain-containing protein [Gemmataceae bacterium]
MRFALVGAILIGALTLAGSMVVAQEHTKDSLDTVKKALAAKKAVLIDVREKAEWEDGHLRDAKLLPLSSLKGETLPADVATLFPKDKVAYLHCAAGGRCLKAAEILRKQGYEVRPLKAGYKSLLKEGFPAADSK